MQHWSHPATDGAKFWISYKQPAFLSSLSHLQVIQNKPPWCLGVAYVIAGWVFKVSSTQIERTPIVLTTFIHLAFKNFFFGKQPSDCKDLGDALLNERLVFPLLSDVDCFDKILYYEKNCKILWPMQNIWTLTSTIPNQPWKGLPGLKSVKGQMLAKLAVAFYQQ